MRDLPLTSRVSEEAPAVSPPPPPPPSLGRGRKRAVHAFDAALDDTELVAARTS